MEEKVYFKSDSICLTNKVWRFFALSRSAKKNDGPASSMKIIPLNAIVSVDLKRDRWWWLFLVLAVLMVGVAFVSYFYIDSISEMIYLLIASVLFAILFIVLAFVRKTRRAIEVLTANNRSNVYLTFVNQEQAYQVLKPMIQCLNERENV
jgi:magnesium-transporting ATPase (P-type)